MDTQQLLNSVVSTIIPAAQNLIGTLLVSSTGVGAAAPLVQALITGIETFRATTEPLYPDSWANVRDPWIATVTQWRTLNPPAPTRIIVQPKGRPDH